MIEARVITGEFIDAHQMVADMFAGFLDAAFESVVQRLDDLSSQPNDDLALLAVECSPSHGR